MSTTRSFPTALALTLAACLRLSGNAGAGTVIQSGEFRITDSGMSASIDFAKFNATLGTLSEVALVLNADFWIAGIAQVTNPTDSVIDEGGGERLSLNYTLGRSYDEFSLTRYLPIEPQAIRPGDTVPVALRDVGLGTIRHLIAEGDAIPAAYTASPGDSTIRFMVGTNCQVFLEGLGTYHDHFDDTGLSHAPDVLDVYGTVTLTYDYASSPSPAIATAPEPSTIGAALLAGVAAIGAGLRRRSRDD